MTIVDPPRARRLQRGCNSIVVSSALQQLSRATALALATLPLSLELNPDIVPVGTCSPPSCAVRSGTYDNAELGWAAVAIAREGAQGAHSSGTSGAAS